MEILDPDPDVRYRALAEMRGRCPMHQLDSDDRFVAVDHPSVATALQSIYDFGGSAGQRGLPEEDTSIAGLLEPRHGAIRRIINAVVAFHKSQRIEPYLTELCADRIAGVVATAVSGEAVEVMSTYVEPLPPAAIFRLFGFDEAEASKHFTSGRDSGAAIAAAVRDGRSLSLRDASPGVAAYIDQQIADRQAMPRDEWPNDALTRFLTTDVDGELLTPRAITTQIIFAAGAGMDTTRNTLGSLLFRLAQDPATYARIRADRSLVEPAIEEALRLDSPAQFLVRQCLTNGVQLGGETLDDGTTVLLSIASANRDEDVFADADRFDIDRVNLREHLAFGVGQHICPGSALARLEMRIALNTWCDHIERFELAPDYRWQPPSTGMLHGPATLWLTVHPAAVAEPNALD